MATLRLNDEAAQYFNDLRQRHFPPERNQLAAHITLFHHLPGERAGEVAAEAGQICSRYGRLEVQVAGLRSLGYGVAFRLESPGAAALRQALAEVWWPYLNSQDKQKWMPHITVQNKVPAAEAKLLLARLQAGFNRWTCAAVGVDLWDYLGGPWQHKQFVPFGEGTTSSV